MLLFKVIIKVRNHCHITGEVRCSAYRDCNMNIKLIHKIPIVFYNLKDYDSHLRTKQELSQFNFEINVTLNGLKNT